MKEGGSAVWDVMNRLKGGRSLQWPENADGFFTTTLSISPLKNAEKLNEIGERAGGRIRHCIFKF